MKHGLFLMLASVLLIVSCVIPAQASSLIVDVQYWLAPDLIQLVISFDQLVQPTYHYRTNPERFVLEIPDCSDIRGDQTLPVNDVTLQRIRVHQLNNKRMQIVCDLTKKVNAEVQVLPRFNGQPDRIVVNLFDLAQETKQPPQAEPIPQPLQVQQMPLSPPPQVEQTPQPQPPQVEQPRVAERPKQHQNYIVVLDPGHGGRDSGAVGDNGVEEKDVVLDLALRIQEMIHKKAANIEVYLTRDKDVFLPLRKRTEIAEKYHADLFVSLHVNANPSSSARGFSVYTLSETATDHAAKTLAEQENAADQLFGGNATPIPIDDSLLTFVLADLSKTSELQHSLEFGKITVNTTVANLRQYRIEKEGLKRANFAVLRTAEMPAVLVESCYLTNARESVLLNQQEFRIKIAQSLTKSTLDYFYQMRNSGQQVVQSEGQPVSVAMLDNSGQQDESQAKVHVVKSGESLSLIAGKYNVELGQLLQANKLAGADTIYVGQQLWIP